MNCGTCAHFDKKIWPKNPMFGRCTYPIPTLPIWAAKGVDESFRNISLDTENCAAHSGFSGKAVPP